MDQAAGKVDNPGGGESIFRIGGPLTGSLAPLYGLVASARNRLYDSGFLVNYPAPLPVICVGNATVGGTGKSPLAAAIAAEFSALGRKPVILSRGYGGTTAGPVEVSGREPAAEVGDEPLMHRCFLNPQIPVVVSRDRVHGAGFIAERKLGDLIVLDDGYQHRRLRRNLNLLLIDISSDEAVREWQEGKLLPAGRFRETPAQALERAGAVILVSRSSLNLIERRQMIIEAIGQKERPVFTVELFPEKVIELNGDHPVDLAEFNGKEVLAACGLARPEHFFQSIETLGLKIGRRVEFGDHHPYSAHDLTALLRPDLPVLISAKDAVKFRPFLSSSDKLYLLLQGVRFLPGDRLRLIELLARTAAAGCA